VQTDRQIEIKLLQYVFGYAPVKLEEIATIIRGGNFQKKDFVETGKPCIHYGQVYTRYSGSLDNNN
jgi:type I restriction enzyme S subunit